MDPDKNEVLSKTVMLLLASALFLIKAVIICDPCLTWFSCIITRRKK